MKKLIITADDFGVFPSINQGITKAILNGKVNSVACLPNHGDSINNVRNLITQVGDLADIGCHLTISSGKPLTIGLNNAFTNGNYFRDFSELDIDGIEKQPEVLRKELIAQIQIFLDNQIPIKHLSCHHNTLTTVEKLFKVYCEVATKFRLPMRSVNIQPSKKDTNYRLVLDLVLMDNVPIKKLKEIRSFRKKIQEVLGTFHSIKTPDLLESRHYGPLPLVDVWESGIERRINKKHQHLTEFLNEFIESEHQKAELMVHLIDYDEYMNDADEKVDEYPGINTKYFDSRQIEFKSLLDFDFIEYSNEIDLDRW